jgi:trehalose-6-phosphatase
VVLDAQTMNPVKVVTQTDNRAVEESFSDYTEVTPGSSVPLTVTIKYTGLPAELGDMVFDWHFKLHDNSLWLLDQSIYRGKRVVWIDQVMVNGH